MLMTAASELVRAFSVLARRAEAGLVRGAARNAAVVVAEHGSRRLEDARTLRDLRRLGFADDAEAVRVSPRRAPR